MLDLDLTNVEAQGDYSPIPAGKYLMRVVEAELKDTAAGTGQFIKVTLEVIGDKYSGRKVFHNFNIKNPNPKTIEIGLGQLKSLLEKSGSNKLKITSPMDLINLEVLTSIKIKKSDDYGDQNVVSSFVKKNEQNKASQSAQAPSDVPF